MTTKISILEKFEVANSTKDKRLTKSIGKSLYKENSAEERDEYAIFEFCKMVYEKNEDYYNFSRLTDDERELEYHLFKLIGYKGFYIENIGGSVRVVADDPENKDYWLVFAEYKMTKASNYKLIASKLIEVLNG